MLELFLFCIAMILLVLFGVAAGQVMLAIGGAIFIFMIIGCFVTAVFGGGPGEEES